MTAISRTTRTAVAIAQAQAQGPAAAQQGLDRSRQGLLAAQEDCRRARELSRQLRQALAGALVATGVLLSAACGPGGTEATVDTCATKMVENLRNGVITVGYPQPECKGLIPEELRLVDTKVATTL